ncbi:MAG: hypothetical protein PUJ82_16340 [Spirochaetales bacterium]|nr:hypothetical protein [Spirochaetales bacterium]MDY5914216.1 hypothetical protein [Treponema sp.]
MWLSFLAWLEQVGSWLLVGVFSAAFVAVVVLIVWKIENRIVAIILTAAGSILCTIPLISTVNLLTEAKAKSLAISEKREELKSLKLQVENESLKKDNLELETKNLNQILTIGNLNNEIDLLKSAQVSMNSLNKICELALLETQLKQTDVHKEQIDTKEGAGVFADRIDNEILVITTHDINAKYGVDLKDVTIKEDSDRVLHVSGIKSKYIGSDKNISDTKLSEIRQVEYKQSKDKRDFLQSNVKVLTDTQSLQRATNYARQYETQFQNRLSLGQESNFLDDAVVKLAQNFITVTLAPLKQEIVFDSQKVEGVPILDYLNEKIKSKQNEIDSVKNKS